MRNFINKTIIEEHKYEVTDGESNVLISEMLNKGFENYKTLGAYYRDDQKILYIVFSKRLIK